MKLEVGVQMQDSTIASLQEALDIQAKCNDITNNNLEVEYEKRIHEYKSYYKREEEQINMLRARIMSWKKSDVMLERKYKKRRNLHLWSRNIFEKECRNSK